MQLLHSGHMPTGGEKPSIPCATTALSRSARKDQWRCSGPTTLPSGSATITLGSMIKQPRVLLEHWRLVLGRLVTQHTVAHLIVKQQCLSTPPAATTILLMPLIVPGVLGQRGMLCAKSLCVDGNAGAPEQGLCSRCSAKEGYEPLRSQAMATDPCFQDGGSRTTRPQGTFPVIGLRS
ncbi:hypothetical protein NDU88_004027 [Pleurodeles waltl]|uniref:Uncharacterized protein n=1 Tax=Pleurodeles waltl TaxID=8319 RepID=A0AAV7SHM7_PLEWA|nr:hypothetical protein NDU88_004027 [Pleurodeles waltl]